MCHSLCKEIEEALINIRSISITRVLVKKNVLPILVLESFTSSDIEVDSSKVRKVCVAVSSIKFNDFEFLKGQSIFSKGFAKLKL